MAVLSDAQREAGWTVVQLGDIAPLTYGKSLVASKRIPGDVPVYSSAGLIDSHNESIIDGQNIIIGRKGTIGSITWSEGPAYPIDTTFYTAGTEKVNIKYLYYLLRTYKFSEMNTDSAVPGLNRVTFESQEAVLPPLEEQERIAGILGSLDDKIEANTRLIQTLSDYCVALVDSLKLFEGSRESTLGEIIAFSPKVKKPAGEEYQFIDMSSLPTMGPIPETISSKNSWNGAKFENGDTLFARITPCLENGKTAIAMGLGDEPACGSTEFIVMRANTPEQVILPYGIARCDKFRQEAMSHMIGSTGRQRVKWQDLANIPVSVPSESDMQKIEKSSDIFGYFEALRKENLQLAETRDALIKRLIG